jgi:hypothetical protein
LSHLSNEPSRITIDPDRIINERDPCHGPILAKKYIDYGPFQPNLKEFPVTAGRKFRSDWYTTYNWLEYSASTDKAYCFPCRVSYEKQKTSKADDAFTVNGTCNWKKALQKFQNHPISQIHLQNCGKLIAFKQSKVSGNVVEQLHIPSTERL